MYELENEEIEIDLKELFGVLKSKILGILLTTVLFIGIFGGVTKFMITPMYSSTAQLYVVSKDGISQLTDLTMGTQLTQDYMAIVETRTVLDKVIRNLKLDMDYKELSEKITVENPADTRIMEISVSDPSPKEAKRITQELTEVTAKTVSSKMDVKAPTIIENAYLADSPDSPKFIEKYVDWCDSWFCFICRGSYVRYIMNDTIRKEEDIEKYLGINTLAKLPLIKGEQKRTKKVRKVQK